MPGVSPAAMQAGSHAAKNVLRQIQCLPPVEWNYFDKGSMATIGRNAAVCEIGRLRFGGLPAWLAWAFVHLYFLIGFRSRFAVFLQWAWAYFTYSKGARLIAKAAGKEGILSAANEIPHRETIPPHFQAKIPGTPPVESRGGKESVLGPE